MFRAAYIHHMLAENSIYMHVDQGTVKIECQPQPLTCTSLVALPRLPALSLAVTMTMSGAPGGVTCQVAVGSVMRRPVMLAGRRPSTASRAKAPGSCG